MAPTRPRTNEVSFIQLHHPHMRLANCNDITTAGFFDKNFHSVPNWLKIYIPTVLQSTIMGQSYSYD